MAENKAGALSSNYQNQVAEQFLEVFQGEEIYPVFQPIINLAEQKILGYEALIRGPQDSLLSSPLQLFNSAARLGLEFEFELLCRKLSIQHYAELGFDELLFLNVSPTSLLHPNFKNGRTMNYLHEYELDISKVVIEVTEYEKIDQFEDMNRALTHYRNMGFRVALDDLGTGYSGLRLWTEILPNYIKIDKHFIRELHKDSMKSNFVSCLISMANVANCEVIAEGVEVAEELSALSKLKMHHAQGYYFAYPSKQPGVELDPSLFDAVNSNSSNTFGTSQESVVELSRSLKYESPNTAVKSILHQFQQNSVLEFIPVVEDDCPLGLIDRNSFFNRLMENQFGVELYGKKPVREFMDSSVLIIEHDCQLSEVSQLVTSTARMEQAFIVTMNGKYHGIGTVRDLLEKITEHKIQYARHSNPLTSLPGIVPVNEQIDRMLKNETTFYVSYYDLDSFKPYNDIYGYDYGDKVIRLLADILIEVYGTEEAYVGHIGGDDFLVVDLSEDYQSKTDAVIGSFKERVKECYRQEHLDAGGMEAKDRNGNAVFFSLVSVSIGIVPPATAMSCNSHIEISDLASEAKKCAKAIAGNSYFVNRRNLESSKLKETVE